MENLYTDELIDLREIARANKDWQLSDNIRNILDNRFVFVFDTKNGQEVYHLSKQKLQKENKKNINNRLFLENKIKKEIKLNNIFDAWLYSINRNISFPNTQL
jgi:hypothetical protein